MNNLVQEIIVNLLLAAVPLFLWILPYALLAVYLERKIAGFMQDRLGPMRVGKWGLLQSLADIVKLLQKEDIMADAVDKKLFNLAPLLVFIGSYAAFATIPFSSIYIGSNIDLGVFFVTAISALVVAGLLLGAWASNNKYSLYGGMRTAAQIVSYEIPTAIVILSVVIIAGTFNLKEMSEQQTANIFNWYIFGGPELGLKKFILIPFMLVGTVIYFISSLAEVNRTPFDIPEAESEIIGGYHTEYSGMKFAFFFLAEYANMFAVSAIITILFFGGYQSPFGYLGNLLNIKWLVGVEQIFWFLFKGLLFVIVQMWLRWTLPRLRVDQLMVTCWKYLIPISLVNLIIIAFISLL
jgi:NADH-quinone oxidoreductase subunit H